MKLLVTCMVLVLSAPSWAMDVRAEMMARALKFFQDEAHPVSGLVRDRASNFGPTPASNRVASIASTGFGLAVIAHAATVGTMDWAMAEAQVLRTLHFVNSRISRHHGWLLHFVDWETGERMWKSEYSTIDTALLVAGGLYAGQVFGGEVMRIARDLHRGMNFQAFMTDEGRKPRKLTLTLSWTPEHGYVPYQWDIYAEQMIMLLLGLSHPTAPMPVESWFAWRRQWFWEGGNLGDDLPLFIHQYSHAFVDFRQLKDGHRDYHQNSVEVSRLHRQGRQEGFWGWSAGDAPAGYRVYSPREKDGTFCIGCAIGSAMFLPTEVLADAQKWITGPYREQIWGQYGFVDGLNLDRRWFAPSVLGITVGPIYMALANTTSESFWKRFMELPEMKWALRKVRR